MRELLERIADALEKIAAIAVNLPAEYQQTPAKKGAAGGKQRAASAERGPGGRFHVTQTHDTSSVSRGGVAMAPVASQARSILEGGGYIARYPGDETGVRVPSQEEAEKGFQYEQRTLPCATLAMGVLSAEQAQMAVSRSQVKRLDAQGKLGPQVAILIGVYIQSWQKRYNTKARPSVNGKERGILLRLVKERSTKELSQLLEVYCQMKNDWYVKKKHDLTTFEQNLNDIVLALSGGKENNGIDYDYVFGRREKNMGDGDDGANIREPDREAIEEIRPEALLPGDTKTTL